MDGNYRANSIDNWSHLVFNKSTGALFSSSFQNGIAGKRSSILRHGTRSSDDSGNSGYYNWFNKIRAKKSVAGKI